MELDKLGVAVVSDETEGVHTEAVDVAERTGDTVAGHGPEECMQGAGLLREEVPGRVVGGGGLGDFVVTAGLDGVDQVGEEDGVLDEEDGDVVSNQVYVRGGSALI